MNKIYHYVLPFPVSVNAIYQVAYKRIILTTKAREYKNKLERAIENMNVENLGKARLSIQYVLFAPDNRDYDVANYEKLLTDCLQGVVFDNDSQIDDNRQTRGQVDPANPRVEVFVKVIQQN